MPSREDHSIIRFRGWEKGLFTNANDVLLEVTETPDALNIVFGEKGKVSKRQGYTKYSTSDPVGMEYGRAIHAFPASALIGGARLVYIDKDGEVHTVSVSGTTLARATDGAADVKIGTERHGHVTFDDRFYLTDTSQGHCYLWTGAASDWLKVTDNVLDGGGPTEFPEAQTLIVHGERIFAGHVANASVAQPRKIHFSNPKEGRTWDTNDFFDLSGSDNENEIIQFFPYQNKILIFRESSISILSGLSADTFKIIDIKELVGTIVQNTIQGWGNNVIWYAPNSGVWIWDGVDAKRIDQPIENDLKDTVNAWTPSATADLTAFSSFLDKDKYYLGVPSTDNEWPSRTYVYDLANETWAKWDFAFSDWVRLDDTIYAVGPSTGAEPSAGIYTVFDDDDDDTVNIASHIETPWFATQDGFMQEHRMRKINLFLEGKSSDSATLTIEVFANWDGGTAVFSTTQSASSNNDFVVVDLSGMDALYNSFKIKLSNTSPNPWAIAGMDVLFSSRPLSRGDTD